MSCINVEAKGSTVPKAFEKLLGREYWDDVNEDQLWAWIEAISTCECNCYRRLTKAIEICGSEDLLLEDNPCLAQKHEPGATWLEDFENQHRMMCKQGEFTPYDDVRLIAWCAERLEKIKQKGEDH